MEIVGWLLTRSTRMVRVQMCVSARVQRAGWLAARCRLFARVVPTMAAPNLRVSLCVVSFLDGPELLQWKAASRRFNCHETDMAIGRWLYWRAQRMDRLAHRLAFRQTT